MNTATLIVTLAALMTSGYGLKCYNGCGMKQKGNNDSVVTQCNSATESECMQDQVCSYGNYTFKVAGVAWKVEQATCSNYSDNNTFLCGEAEEIWSRDNFSDWDCSIRLCNTTLCNSGLNAGVSLIVGGAMLFGLLWATEWYLSFDAFNNYYEGSTQSLAMGSILWYLMLTSSYGVLLYCYILY